MEKKEDKLIISFLALLFAFIGAFVIMNISFPAKTIFIILYYGFAFYFRIKFDDIYFN